MLDPYELKLMFMDVAELTAATLAAKLGLEKDEISQRAAYREFGEAKVKRWVAKGVVTRLKLASNNSKVEYSRKELLALKMAEQKAKYLAKH